MKDLIRVVLVDPGEESRNELQRLLRGIDSLWLAEVVTSLQDAVTRAGGNRRSCDDRGARPRSGPGDRADSETVTIEPSHRRIAGQPLRRQRADLESDSRRSPRIPAAARRRGELLDTVSRLLRGHDESLHAQAQGPRIITVTGAAGGVGCTTLAVNLACSLVSPKDQETILLDLDLMFGGVDAYLDITPDHTLTHVIQSFDRLDLTLLKRSITRHSSGLYVLPHPTAIQEAAAIDPETLRRLFGLLRAAFSTVVIDASKGLQSSDFSAFELSDVIIVVIQLDLLCLRNTARLLGLFREYDGLIDRVKLVVNRSDSWECQINPKKAEETLKMPISWSIPNSAKAFQEARLKGVPLRRGRQGQPRPPGLSRNGPIAAAGGRDRFTQTTKKTLRRVLLNGADSDVARIRTHTALGPRTPIGSGAATALEDPPSPTPGEAPPPAAAPVPSAAASAPRRANPSRRRKLTRPRCSTKRSSAISTCVWSIGST